MATKLSDDETYLKKYDNLSRGEKQQLDLSKRARLAEAQVEADAGDTLGQRASDIGGKVLRGAAALTGSQSAARKQEEAEALTAKRESERQRRLQEAKDSANYKERDRTLYGSETPAKLKDNQLDFKKGGSVKGWGMARGARKAKMY
jgi:hypothetical protein